MGGMHSGFFPETEIPPSYTSVKLYRIKGFRLKEFACKQNERDN